MENAAHSDSQASSAEVQSQTLVTRRYIRLHLLVGWWSLLAFVAMGILLEIMQGFRVPAYMNVGDEEMRRQMWTLAHAHGVLISLVHFAFVITIFMVGTSASRCIGLASCCLISAGILMPVGFFLGGLFIYPGDPGLGVFLVPPGALLLFVAVCLTGVAVTRSHGLAVGTSNEA